MCAITAAQVWQSAILPRGDQYNWHQTGGGQSAHALALRSHPSMLSALRKIGKASLQLKHGRGMSLRRALDLSAARTLDPHTLSDVLLRIFNLRLGPEELGALVMYLDRDGSGTCSCGSLSKALYTLAGENMRRRRAELRQHTQKFKEAEAIHAEYRQRRFRATKEPTVVFPDLLP